jgi:large subunit ribosomal protein L10
MPNRINRLMCQEYADRLRDAEYMIAIGYEGLDIDGTNALRAELEEKNMMMLFVKNRIVRRTFEEEFGITGVDGILDGQCAFVRGEDPVAMARTLRDFAKEHKQLQFRGAVIERTVLDEAGAKDLAEAASREELQARVAGAALAPGANLAGAALGPGAAIAGCIKSLIEKLEETESAA